MQEKKIVIVGAGSLLAFEIISSAARLAKDHGKVRVVLVDLDAEKAALVARLARRMPEVGPEFMRLSSEKTLERAAEGADAVYSVIRACPAAVHQRDCEVSVAHGFHGDDTYGPSAYMLALRTAPVLLDFAAIMQRQCPKAWFCVFTNPVTIMTDLLSRLTKIRTLGLCNGAENFERDFDHFHGDPPEAIKGLKWTGGGLNHFSWVSNESTFRGETVHDYLRRHLETLDQRKLTPAMIWNMEKPVFEFVGQMPMNNGHFYHYFLWDQVVRGGRKWLRQMQVDAKRGKQPDVWGQMRQVVAGGSKALPDFWEQLPFLGRDLKHTNLGMRSLFSIWNDLGWQIPVNVPNRGHVKGLPEGAVVEATTRMTAEGAQPLGLDPLPPMLKGLMGAVAYQQRMVADWVLEPSKQGLKEIIFADPCHRSLASINSVAEKLWKHHESERA
ncbi:MAG: hypothetical protein WCI17_02850 [bacterium]